MTTMKKTTYLILLLALCGINLVHAEKVNLCQALQKLGEQCDDFSSWKGSEITGEYGKFVSSLEIEGAERTCIKQFLNDLSFFVEYGKFENEAAATAKVESLKNEVLAAYPIVKFAETRSTFNDPISYLVMHSADGFRVYSACFKISKYGQRWDVSFEFPQTKKKDAFSKNETKPYVDYVRIKVPLDSYDFNKDVRRLLVEAKTAFTGVKGEKLETMAMFDQFAPTFIPSGRKNCYIEDRGLGVIFYEIPIMEDVTLEQLQQNAGNVVNNIQRTFGPDYGYSQSADGMSVSFAHVDRPYFVAGVLYVLKSNDSYSMNLSIRAEPKVIK